MYSFTNKYSKVFGYVSVLFTGLGFTIVSPVLPFLTLPYSHSIHQQAFYITLLMSVYALAAFLSAPILGSLSDHFGRRPILIISLLGSSIGYLLFGLGNSIWMLFLGRIIEGLTAGEISTLYAYFADITEPNERTKVFGWMGALVGIGTTLGPIIGGLLAELGNSVPIFIGALFTFLNAVYGYTFLQESLPIKKRSVDLSFSHVRPFHQLQQLFKISSVIPLLTAGFAVWLAAGSLQSIFSQFSIDAFQWKAGLVGLSFSLIGILDTVSQLFIMPRLLKKFSEQQITRIGMFSEILAYLFITLSGILLLPILFLFGIICYGFGDSIFTPVFNGQLSNSVSDNQQGLVMGGTQSIQSLSRVIGPLIAGQLYAAAPFLPTVFGFLLMIFAYYHYNKK
ncbi:TPA: TCR/Tet family MFS transporter [Enterococcus faecium]|uniref:MFS transporter n=1 Tax=Enterococcus TaxID=1350 RepID=UPI000CF123C0|nr:MFS transporter [Enterococcus faecium]EGP4919743.1 TCR/Tet family MFS transporter [Enterococcus faecium]EME8164561.1 MFS transporter [Enterococcus faecium]EME8229139.1 MFS transporter [Enterococcus faecium]EMF0278190.1 MFS transporter [Enterococcus faecium]MBD9739082.1 MFS transporter [Enterococcus faecium]